MYNLTTYSNKEMIKNQNSICPQGPTYANSGQTWVLTKCSVQLNACLD